MARTPPAAPDAPARKGRPRLEVDGRRTVSAAQAISVALLGLLIAGLVNADSLVASIQGQSFGTSRSVGLALARRAKTVSHWTGLNLPRKFIDDLVNGPSKTAAAPPRPHPAPANAGATSTTTTTIPLRRVPSQQKPLKVWLAGDSMMGTIAESFIDETGGNPLISSGQDFRIGTGLTRPDVYDWPAAISREVASANPDVVILLFGANDDQDMEVASRRFSLQTPAWEQEYTRRVNDILAATANGVRQVIWLGIPAVKRPRLNETKDIINGIVRSAAAAHPNVTFVDTGPVLDGPGNAFETYRSDPGGKAVTIRETDGIHITLAGANLITPSLTADIDQLWHLPT